MNPSPLVSVAVGGEEFELRDLKVGASATRLFVPRKENNFLIIVRFESGRTMQRKIGYVTPAVGQHHQLTVSNDDVDMHATPRK